MPAIPGSKRLVWLVVGVLIFCAGWTYATESRRAHKTIVALQHVSASDLNAVYIEGHTITNPSAIAAILHTLQATQWHTFERNYAQDRHRLVLSFRTGYPWMIDVRSSTNGSSVVQVLRRDGLAEQRETVMASGDNADLWPMLQGATGLQGRE
jgi:hypothetical protein